jgi:hypothetical protein
MALNAVSPPLAFSVDPEQPGDFGSGSIVQQHLFRFSDLRARKLRRPPKVATGSLGGLG